MFIFGNNMFKNRGRTKTTKSWNTETSLPGLPLSVRGALSAHNPQSSSQAQTLQLLQESPEHSPRASLPLPASPGAAGTQPRWTCSPRSCCWDFPAQPSPELQPHFTDHGQAAAVTALLCSSSSEQQCRSQLELKRLLDAQGRDGGLRLLWAGELRLIATLRMYKTCEGKKEKKKKTNTNNQIQPNKQQRDRYHL